MSFIERFFNLLKTIGISVAGALVVGIVGSIFNIMDVIMGCLIVILINVLFDVLLEIFAMKGGVLGAIAYSICFLITAILAVFMIIEGKNEMGLDKALVNVTGTAFVLSTGTNALLFMWDLSNLGFIDEEYRKYYGPIAGIGVGVLMLILQAIFGDSIFVVTIIINVLLVGLTVLFGIKFGFPFIDEDMGYSGSGSSSSHSYSSGSSSSQSYSHEGPLTAKEIESELGDIQSEQKSSYEVSDCLYASWYDLKITYSKIFETAKITGTIELTNENGVEGNPNFICQKLVEKCVNRVRNSLPVSVETDISINDKRRF